MQVTASEITSRNKNRIFYLDFLRVLAIYTTVGIHILTQVWTGADVYGFSWKIYNIFLSGYSWGVPVFTMISGALFLDSKRSIDRNTLYSKNIRKILIGFCFWSVAYAIIFDLRSKGVQKFLYSIFTGEFHLWFLIMIAVMYMLTPLLRKFTCDKMLTEYFLKLSAVISFVIPQSLFLLNLLDIPYLNNIIQGLSKTFGEISGFFPHFYLFYFVAGYYFSVTELTPRVRKRLYILGILGYLFTVVATDRYSCFLGAGNEAFYNKNWVNLAFMTVAVFVFGKYELGSLKLSEKAMAFIGKLSAYSIGIYYVHLMLIKGIYGLLDLSQRDINPFITCLVFPVLFFFLSAFATAVMRKLPLLNKVV